MILQSLSDYYERARKDGSRDLPPYGYAQTAISFVVELDASGALRTILPLFPAEEKRKRSVGMQTPFLGKARTSGIEPNFLWDNPEYVFGLYAKGKEQRALDYHAAFVELHEKLLADAVDPGLKAVLAFIRSWRPEDASSLPLWDTIVNSTANNIVFKLDSADCFVHDGTEAKGIWRAHFFDGEAREGAEAINGGMARILEDRQEKKTSGRCLVTGDHAVIAELHPALKGLYGAQSTGAGLSTYNMQSSESFNKVQNYNAPVGKYTAFAYATALNSLLADNRRRLLLGDSTMVVWADEPSEAEDWLMQIIEPPPEISADSGAQGSKKASQADAGGRKVDERTAGRVREILEKLLRGEDADGEIDNLNPSAVFHLLCLAPNAARVAVRFHVSETLGRLLARSAEHYSQLRIIRRYEKEPRFISAYLLAKELAGKHKKPKDIQRLASDLVEAIVTGRRYPHYMLAMAIDRIRAERDVTYIKAAMLKAILIRNHKKEISVGLNPESTDVAYQLGRLFALLEGVQRKALGDINANIRDKFYGAAASTPATVFPLLLKNAQNHISKAKAGGYDKLIGEALSHIGSEDGFPIHLTLERQGRFALGYYHQRYSRNTTDASDGAATEEAGKD